MTLWDLHGLLVPQLYPQFPQIVTHFNFSNSNKSTSILALPKVVRIQIFFCIIEDVLESLAAKWSPEDVANFLGRIKLSQYSEIFKREGVSGDLLIDVYREVLADDLEVTTPLHQMKIMQLFRRELNGSVAKYSTEYLSQFLQTNQLEKYIPTVKEHGIDGDMILEVEDGLIRDVLLGLGVSKFDVIKIRKKFKQFVSNES